LKGKRPASASPTAELIWLPARKHCLNKAAGWQTPGTFTLNLASSIRQPVRALSEQWRNILVSQVDQWAKREI
jgi:hypothetical protein